jgi:HD-GYP domain-containing protein (c-di-GMP phosphodiesterase class II)
VCVCLIAIGTAAWAMAVKGWDITSLEMSFVMLGLASIAVMHVHRFVTGLKRRSTMLHQAAMEAERHYIDVLTRITKHVEARDQYWKGHSRNVAALCEKIAFKLGMSKDQCELMNLAGLLHDIGIIAVPATVRSTRNRLAPDQLHSMQMHPQVSYEVLKPLQSIAPVLLAIRHHHERMNGTGYPDHLAGQKIPLAARIIAVADSYDAMTHDRPHRPAVTPLQALTELCRCAPSGYDPRCVEALAEIMNLSELETAASRKEQRQIGTVAGQLAG